MRRPFLIKAALAASLLALSMACAHAQSRDEIRATAIAIDGLLTKREYAAAETQAKQLLEAILAAKEESPAEQRPEYAEAIRLIAYALAGQGRAVDALPLLTQVIELMSQSIGPDSTGVLQALDDKAAILKELGRYEEAAAAHRQALASREKVLGPNDPLIASTLAGLAQNERRLGKAKEAEANLRRAIGIFETSAAGDGLSRALADLADLLAEEGRPDEADPLATRALALAQSLNETTPDELSRRLIKLGNVKESLGRFTDAEPLFKQALEIREQTFGAGSRQAAGALSNLADSILNQGRAADAEPLLRDALARQKKVRGATHPAVGTSLLRLANALREQGKLDDAEPLYEQALAVRERAFGERHLDVAAVLEDYGDLAFRNNDFTKAFKLYKRASDIIAEREAAGDPSGIDQGIFKSKRGQAFRRLAETGFEIAERDEAQRVPLAIETFAAAQFMTRSRTGVALDQLAVRIGLSDPALAALVRERQDLVAKWQETERQLIAGLGQGKPKTGAAESAKLAAAMTKLEASMKALDGDLRARSPRYAELAQPAPVTMLDVQADLGAGEALVTYLINADDTLIWVITKDKVVWVHNAITEARLNELVARVRIGLEPGKDKKLGFDTAAAHELYRAVLGDAEVEQAIAGKSHVIVVPSGVLTSLPFQVLLTGPAPDAGAIDFRTAPWLIRRHALSVLPTVSSLRLLRDANAASSAPLPFIGFGDPQFKRPLSNGDGAAPSGSGSVDSFFRGREPSLEKLSKSLTALPETADELRRVAETLGADKSSVVLKEAASEANLKALSQSGDLAKYRIVHFATHGLVAGDVDRLLERRAEPALALALPDSISKVNDGLLTASEAAELKLDADWVILSACNTAAADKPGAEALSGLVRSFVYAGARSMLVSHWSVDSRAAVRLVTGTVQRLAADAKLGRAEALRQAMLAEIEASESSAKADPRLWAPFSFIGYGGP